jgi:hypothetical protein
MPIKHATQTVKPDDPARDISKDEWNASHTVTSGSAPIIAGNSYVDVPHGLGTTPDINTIKPSQKDCLFGRGYWVSDVGAVTFRINIDSPDSESNHSFGYIIV